MRNPYKDLPNPIFVGDWLSPPYPERIGGPDLGCLAGKHVPSVTTQKPRRKKTTGLRYWMLQVLEQCKNVSTDFSPEPVHDLRVSLRRCRSLADGLMALDPDPNWKAMKKAGKRLFQRLGDLRDVHVMMEWIEKLEPTRVGAGDPSASLRAGSPALLPSAPLREASPNKSSANPLDPA